MDDDGPEPPPAAVKKYSDVHVSCEFSARCVLEHHRVLQALSRDQSTCRVGYGGSLASTDVRQTRLRCLGGKHPSYRKARIDAAKKHAGLTSTRGRSICKLVLPKPRVKREPACSRSCLARLAFLILSKLPGRGFFVFTECRQVWINTLFRSRSPMTLRCQ